MSWTATSQIASSQTSLIRVFTIKFPASDALAGGQPPFVDQLRLERGSTENLAALNSVAGLAGIGRRFPGAFGNGAAANPGSKIIAFPERIHLDAEYRTSREAGRRNALLRHSCGARHLYTPIDQFSVFVLGKFAVGRNQIEVEFGMVGLSDELVGHAG